MKTCPDIDRLIELLNPENRDFEAQDHVQNCAECRANLALVRRIPAVVEPRLQVSEAVLLRTRAAIDQMAATALHTARVDGASERADSVPGAAAARALDLALSGVLGAVTAIAILMAVGVPSETGAGDLLGYSAMLGALTVLWESRRTDMGA